MRVLISALLVGAAFLLVACEDREVARARNEERLPPGCKIIDLDYGDLSAAVVCDGRKSTTSLRSWDETTMMWQATGTNGSGMMVPIVTHHSRLIAEIGQP